VVGGSGQRRDGDCCICRKIRYRQPASKGLLPCATLNMRTCRCRPRAVGAADLRLIAENIFCQSTPYRPSARMATQPPLRLADLAFLQ